jgi:hypothetical protein
MNACWKVLLGTSKRYIQFLMLVLDLEFSICGFQTFARGFSRARRGVMQDDYGDFFVILELGPVIYDWKFW